MITIRFHPTTYTVAESAGSVNVIVNMLNGTLVRDVHVFLMTSLTDGTATGILLLRQVTSDLYDIANANLLISSSYIGLHSNKW